MGEYTLGQLLLMVYVSFAIITVPGLLMGAYWAWEIRKARKEGVHPVPSILEEVGTIEEPRHAA